jgi:hypothetical protein
MAGNYAVEPATADVRDEGANEAAFPAGGPFIVDHFPRQFARLIVHNSRQRYDFGALGVAGRGVKHVPIEFGDTASPAEGVGNEKEKPHAACPYT